MRRFNVFVLNWVAILLIVGCSPKIISTPAPVPQPAPAQVAQPAAPSIAVSPEDAAWAKVVEAAKKEGKLTVYSVHLVGDVANNVSQAFNKRTGLRLEIIGGLSATALERIKTERRAGLQVASAMTGNTAMYLVAKQQDGLTQSAGDLPELRTERIREGIRYEPRIDKEGHVLGVAASAFSTWINSNLVRPGTEPKSYRDLLKPEWKGKIAIGDPVIMPNASLIYWPLTSRNRLDDTYFRALGKQELQVQAAARMDMEALSRGQALLALAGASPSAAPFLTQGAPIKAVDMAEGVPISRTSAVSLIQGAPHPNAGRVFINWLFSQEGQTVFLGTLGLMGFRKDVPNFEPPQAQLAPANPIVLNSEDELQVGVTQRQGVVKKLFTEGIQ